MIWYIIVIYEIIHPVSDVWKTIIPPSSVCVHNNNLFPSPPFIIISITANSAVLSASQAKILYYVLEQCNNYITVHATLPPDRGGGEGRPLTSPHFPYVFLRVWKAHHRDKTTENGSKIKIHPGMSKGPFAMFEWTESVIVGYGRVLKKSVTVPHIY
jgi:hypothetical protein